MDEKKKPTVHQRLMAKRIHELEAALFKSMAHLVVPPKQAASDGAILMDYVNDGSKEHRDIAVNLLIEVSEAVANGSPDPLDEDTSGSVRRFIGMLAGTLIHVCAGFKQSLAELGCEFGDDDVPAKLAKDISTDYKRAALEEVLESVSGDNGEIDPDTIKMALDAMGLMGEELSEEDGRDRVAAIIISDEMPEGGDAQFEFVLNAMREAGIKEPPEDLIRHIVKEAKVPDHHAFRVTDIGNGFAVETGVRKDAEKELSDRLDDIEEL